MKDKTTTSAEYQNNKLIKCELCGNLYKSITNSHLRNKHNTKTTEYKKQFPESKMISDDHINRLTKFAKSEAGISNAITQLKKQWNSHKRKEAVRQVVISKKYREQQSNIMKEYVKHHPESVMWKSIKGKLHPHYKKSNWQRWFEKYGKDEADIRLQNWKQKNKIRAGSRNTNIEIEVKRILDKNDIQYIHQFDKILSYYVDFYLPDYNLVLEVFGDYWHCNPTKYNENEIVKFPGNRLVTAKSVWLDDITRINEIKKCGYNTTYIFGSDISEDKVLELINNFDKDIVQPHGKL